MQVLPEFPFHNCDAGDRYQRGASWTRDSRWLAKSLLTKRLHSQMMQASEISRFQEHAAIFITINMAHPRYPSISLLRALKVSCESLGYHSPSGANTASKLTSRYPQRENVCSFTHRQRRIQIRQYSSFFNKPLPNRSPSWGSHHTSFLRCHQRDFSTTSSLQAFKTVQEAKSRHGLGVLQIPLGQALFRGACLVKIPTDL